jgi:hypothetical protein
MGFECEPWSREMCLHIAAIQNPMPIDMVPALLHSFMLQDGHRFSVGKFSLFNAPIGLRNTFNRIFQLANAILNPVPVYTTVFRCRGCGVAAESFTSSTIMTHPRYHPLEWRRVLLRLCSRITGYTAIETASRVQFRDSCALPEYAELTSSITDVIYPIGSGLTRYTDDFITAITPVLHRATARIVRYGYTRSCCFYLPPESHKGHQLDVEHASISRRYDNVRVSESERLEIFQLSKFYYDLNLVMPSLFPRMVDRAGRPCRSAIRATLLSFVVPDSYLGVLVQASARLLELVRTRAQKDAFRLAMHYHDSERIDHGSKRVIYLQAVNSLMFKAKSLVSRGENDPVDSSQASDFWLNLTVEQFDVITYRTFTYRAYIPDILRIVRDFHTFSSDYYYSRSLHTVFGA